MTALSPTPIEELARISTIPVLLTCEYAEKGRRCDRPAYFRVILDDVPASVRWERRVCSQHAMAAVYVAKWRSDVAGETAGPYFVPIANTGAVMVDRMGPEYDACFPDPQRNAGEGL